VGVPAPAPPGSALQAASKKLAMIKIERMGRAFDFMVDFSSRVTLSIYCLTNAQFYPDSFTRQG